MSQKEPEIPKRKGQAWVVAGSIEVLGRREGKRQSVRSLC